MKQLPPPYQCFWALMTQILTPVSSPRLNTYSRFNWVFLQQHLKDQDVPHQHPKEALSMNVSTILSDKSIFLLSLAHEAQVNKWGKVVQENRKCI